jgi:hypothetical protein
MTATGRGSDLEPFGTIEALAGACPSQLAANSQLP